MALWLKYVADGVIGRNSRLVMGAALGLGVSATGTWFLRVIWPDGSRRLAWLEDGIAQNDSNGRITLLVSHRFRTVRMADLIVVLDGARVVEVGSHEKLLAQGGSYAELYGIQAAAYGKRPPRAEDRAIGSRSVRDD